MFAGKYSMNMVYGELRRELGEQFRRLSVQKGCEIVEGHLMSDHVHILTSIPPKYSAVYSLKLRLVVLTTLVRS